MFAVNNIITKYGTLIVVTWWYSDRASWNDYILITNLMHWLLFIHKILFSSACFDPQLTLCTDRPPRTLIES